MTDIADVYAACVVCVAFLLAGLFAGSYLANSNCVKHFDHLTVVEANTLCKKIIEGTK